MIAENLQGFESIPQTIPHFCLESFRRYKKENALSYKIKDSWKNLSGNTVIDKVRYVALGLAEMGIGAGDRVAIISENRPEWSIADLAVLSLRAVIVPIYTTQAVDQIRYILEDSDSKALLISGKKLWNHAEAAVRTVERLEKLIFFESDAVPEDDWRAFSLEAVEERGKEVEKIDSDSFKRSLDSVESDDLATIIYTSGTTGEPKGVLLNHKNFVVDAIKISNELEIRSTDSALSVLPLSHIFERTVFYVLCVNGVSIHYCESFDKLASALREVKPTIMTAVPRLFEQVYHKIVRKGRAAGGVKTKLFNWSLTVGQDYWDRKNSRKAVSPVLAARHALANRLVFSKWREGIGGQMRFFVSGGAPLSKKLSNAFWAAGIPILQGYGMTEGCIVCANRPENNRVGSIGIPFKGIEMKIDETDGEILVRGDTIMSGYLNKPEETEKVIDKDGWYHTGDVGRVDSDGHFFITDRKKDLFKLSNGKYVAPQQVESLLKQSAFVGQAVVVGSGRKQVGALIVPEWESLKAAAKKAGIGITGKSREELSENRDIIKLVQNDAIKYTKELNDYERVKRVYLVSREFSIDKGEMTPTLKIKRGVIDEKYADAISMISGS